MKHAQITAAQTASTQASRNLAHLMEVERAYLAFDQFISDLRFKNTGEYTRNTEWSYLRLLEAMEFAFQVDVSEHLANLRHELNIDEDGYTLNDDGEPTAHRIHTPWVAYGSEARAA